MRVLIVDDDPGFRRKLRRQVVAEWPGAIVDERQPSSAHDRPDTLPIGDADALLLGHPIGAEVELEWLRELRRRADCPPIVLFADPSDERLAVDALKAGAADYFPKADIRHRRLVDTLRAELRLDIEPGAAGSPAAHAEVGPAVAGIRGHRIVETLHETDVATVYLAEAQDRSGRVVLKVVRHLPDDDAGSLFDRFLQEYEVVAMVRHPNVVRIFDLGIADDHAYIVMEYLPAGSLADRIDPAGGPERAIGYLRQMAQALVAIHEAGILHRDLKPANVMFRSDESLALIDFGLAKKLRLEAALTGIGQIFGTPYYMSPEQGHAQPTDPRSDLYSLGCILYEMLTGEKPFVASSAMGVIYRHAHAPRPRLSPQHASLQGVLDRLLAVNPADRYRDASELLAALPGGR